MKNRKVFDKIKNEINSYTSDSDLANYVEDLNVCCIVLDLRTGPIYKEYSNNSLLCNEIYDFIDSTYRLVKKRKQLFIKILYPNNINDDEKNKIEKILKAHYAIELQINRQESKKIHLLSGILLAIGSLFFIIYGLLEWYEVNFLYIGIIEIVSWVFIWEACYAFFFQNTSNKVELVKNLKKFEAEVIRE